MTKPLWVDQIECSRRAICRMCRNATWYRREIERKYAVPEGWPECPFGRGSARGKATGLGDVVEKVLNVTGIGPLYKKVRGGGCGGCAKRRDWLNKKFPLRGKTGE